MKAKAIKTLQSGIYYVAFEFSDFTPEELAKMRSFGVPVIQIRMGPPQGQSAFKMAINQITANHVAGFTSEEEAKDYEASVLNQVKSGMDFLRQRKDDFSSIDEVEI